MTYSIDFRQHVLFVMKQERLSHSQTAARFKIGRASLARWLRSIKPAPHPMRKRKLDKSALARDCLEYPDVYQSERALRFGVSRKAIWQALKKIGVTYKKNP